MKILITGNLGYLGPVVCRHLRATIPGVHITGFDTGYFADCWTVQKFAKEEEPHKQVIGDLRSFPATLLEGIDAVLHLAAISNDPMGKQFEQATREVNFEGTVKLAKLAKEQGVPRFVFASSCSVYGLDDGTLKSERSDINPLSAYAESKVNAEREIEKLAGKYFRVTALRFATACGFSPRCRLDLVLNDFVASALSSGEITLLSDGSPWRPLIHVADMARAMEWALTRDSDAAYLAVNAGSADWNYQMKDLAEAVSEQFDGVPVKVNEAALPDKRSYRVDFSVFRKLAPKHQPQWTLEKAVGELVDGLRPVVGKGMDFRKSSFIRLHVLSELMGAKRLDAGLRWLKALVA
jgi:nucleoside-diphosphate-sugar epimerase